MRKKLLNSFIVLLICSPSLSQVNLLNANFEGLYNFSKSYFRSDPFSREFSSFLKHLINDPDIYNKVVQKRTDTSLYSFSGIYKSYNPFFFKPKRVEVLLEETSIQYDDSLHTTDTVFMYQLMAYADDDDKSMKEIKKEFEKIHRQNNKKFYDSKYWEEKKVNEVTVAAHHYFVALHQLSPLSVVWGKLEKSHETVLNITLRIKMSGNETILPAPFFIP